MIRILQVIVCSLSCIDSSDDQGDGDYDELPGLGDITNVKSTAKAPHRTRNNGECQKVTAFNLMMAKGKRWSPTWDVLY
jgi:hypothetical protein